MLTVMSMYHSARAVKSSDTFTTTFFPNFITYRIFFLGSNDSCLAFPSVTIISPLILMHKHLASHKDVLCRTSHYSGA